ncbi:MAG: hypothetical protein HY930_05455 [Euryarchaeota archaeon]|nr:hypothetical protein [Euryarchaeota archaeon]
MLYRLLFLILGLLILLLILRSVLEETKIKIREAAFRRKFEKVEEPKSEVRREGSTVLLKMQLPGVKSKSDVSLRMMRDSIEIRAYAGDKMYFKLFQIPAKSRITSTKLEGEELEVEIWI